MTADEIVTAYVGSSPCPEFIESVICSLPFVSSSVAPVRLTDMSVGRLTALCDCGMSTLVNLSAPSMGMLHVQCVQCGFDVLLFSLRLFALVLYSDLRVQSYKREKLCRARGGG